MTADDNAIAITSANRQEPQHVRPRQRRQPPQDREARLGGVVHAVERGARQGLNKGGEVHSIGRKMVQIDWDDFEPFSFSVLPLPHTLSIASLLSQEKRERVCERERE